MAVVVVFMANLAFATLAYRIRTCLDFPPLDNYEEIASANDDETLLIWLARGTWEAYQANEGDLRQKATWVRLSTTSTMVNLGLASVTLVVTTWPW